MAEKTIQQILIDNAKSGANKGITFIEGPNKTDFLSYKQLYLQALYVLNALQEKGLKPGDELMFQFKSNRSFLITFWACIFGRIIPVPITFGVNKGIYNKVRNVWNSLNHPYLISDFPSWLEKIAQFEPENSPNGRTVRDNFIQFQGLEYTKKGEVMPATTTDLAYLQFSSGSTGEPKGVMIKQENLLSNVGNLSNYFNISGEDNFLGWLPLTHDMGLILFHFLPLVNNASQHIIPPFMFLTFPELWVRSLSDYKISMSGSPNFGYKYVVDSVEEMDLTDLDLSNLKLLINGAEPVSIELCKKFNAVFEPYGLKESVMRPAYGLAEAVLAVSFWPHDDQPLMGHYLNRNKLGIGSEVEFLEPSNADAASFADLGTSWMEIKITDEQGNYLPPDTLGVVHLRGADITSGYYNKPEVTRKVLSSDGWFNTGDLGLIHNGHLILTGRVKEMILIGGQNYFPNDLDKIIEELPFIKFQQVATCGIYNHQSQKDDIYVFLNLQEDASSLEEMANAIRKHLGARTRLGITRVIPVNKIPLTTSGKVRRHVLAQNYLNGVYDHLMVHAEERVPAEV